MLGYLYMPYLNAFQAIVHVNLAVLVGQKGDILPHIAHIVGIICGYVLASKIPNHRFKIESIRYDTVIVQVVASNVPIDRS